MECLGRRAEKDNNNKGRRDWGGRRFVSNNKDYGDQSSKPLPHAAWPPVHDWTLLQIARCRGAACGALLRQNSSSLLLRLLESKKCSHDADLVGNLKGVVLLGEDHVGLLVTAGGDEGVYLLDLDRVEFLAGLLDSGLGGTLVDNEDEGVVVLDGLDGALGAAGELDHGVLVPGVLLDNGVRDGLGGAGKTLGLGHAEGSLEPDLGLGCGVLSFLHVLGNCFSLNAKLTHRHDLPVWSFVCS